MTDQNLARVERLRPWAEARGRTTAELAIAWLLAHPTVATVIVGARTASQVEANLKAADWPLTPSEREEVASLARSGSRD
jgi:aryl-alcohol dehydrogenase-like predicted oxidoreductase